MSNLRTVDQVRETFAAFEAGNVPLKELEMVVADAIQSGLWTPTRILELLRDAVARGTVPIETLQRLGLSDKCETVLRSPQPSLGTSNSAGSRPTDRVDSSASQRSPDRAIGVDQFIGGRYLLERKIGEGGMGVVYFASDQHVKGEHFAVKVLQQDIRKSPESLKLLREEVRKTRTLAHPNIVGVYSLNVDGEDVFVLMEYLEGKTLLELLDQDFGRGMRFDRAWPLIEGIGAGLAYAHDHSIIHGDLKPSNVFVTTAGKAKLLDFGIARAAHGPARKLDSIAAGALTPAYASCEMLEFLTPDMRDDIYAFSCIIYESLSGKHPFGGRNAVVARDADEKPAPIDSLTTRQNAALAQGLAFDRAARTATVEALLAGLAPASNSQSLRSGPSRVTWIACLLIAGVFALSYFLVDRYRRLTPTRAFTESYALKPNVTSEKSIAVLPFMDMSENKDQEYFADGIAEEVLDRLAKVPGLKVVGRSSSFQFKNKTADPASIGAALGVSYLLEGSVRKEGARVRVAAQLVDTRTNAQRWSDRFDSEVVDVLNLQDTVAIEIARALQITVEPDTGPRASVKSPEALDAYLHGLQSFDRQSRESVEAAVANFEQALALNPTFTPAAIGLAKAYTLIGNQGWLPTKIAFERARKAALLAQQLDPESPAPHVRLADIYVVYDWDWAGADRELQQALALGPRDSEWARISAERAAAIGQWDDARQLGIEAVALDPLSPEVYMILGWGVYLRTGDFTDAERSFRRGLQIAPKSGSGQYFLGLALMLQGHYDAALTEFRKETPDDGQFEGSAMAYFAAGRKAESDAALAEAIRHNGASWPSEIARVYAFRGEKALAFEWLNRAYEARDEDLYVIKGDPLFKNLEGDARYKAFLKKMNFPE